MKTLSAEFVTSAAANGAGIPRDGVPHIALAGRSNVGKSSLINALVRTPIARTSAAPGKTRLANIYRVTLEGGAAGPGRWSVYLVDLPGYGYARGGADAARELAAVAEAYFSSSAGRGFGPASAAEDARYVARGFSPASAAEDARLKPRASDVAAALLLVDSRHPGLESDLQAQAWLRSVGVEPHVVATKIDKLSRAERARNLKALGDMLGTAALPVSVESGEGLDALWRLISKATTSR